MRIVPPDIKVMRSAPFGRYGCCRPCIDVVADRNMRSATCTVSTVRHPRSELQSEMCDSGNELASR